MALRFHAHDVGTVAELMRVARLAGFEVGTAASQSLTDLYLDTDAFALLGQGYALRLRQHDGAFEGVLLPLASVEGVADEGALSPERARQVVPGALPLPLASQDLTPGALRAALLDLVGDAPLILHARVRVERMPRPLREGDRHVGELAVDSVHYEWARERDGLYEVCFVPGADAALGEERLGAMLRAYGLRELPPARFTSVVERLSRGEDAPLLLLPDERARLHALADDASPIQRRRAQALLAVSDGTGAPEAALELGMDAARVRRWVQRFREVRLRLFEEGQTTGTDAPGYRQDDALTEAGLPASEDTSISTAAQREASPAPPPSDLPFSVSASPPRASAPDRDADAAGGSPSPDVQAPAAMDDESPAILRVGATRPEDDAEAPGGASPPRERGGVIGRVARAVRSPRRWAQRLQASGSDPLNGGRLGYYDTPHIVGDGLPEHPTALGQAATQTPLGSPAPSVRSMALLDAIEADAERTARAWASAVAQLDAGGTVRPLAQAGRALLGVLDLYHVYLDPHDASLRADVAALLVVVDRVRAFEVMARLWPDSREDPNAPHVAERLKSRHQYLVGKLRARLDAAGAARLDGEVAQLMEAVRSGSEHAGVRLRHVLGSAVWQQHERVQVLARGGSDRGALTRQAAALGSLEAALHRAFPPSAVPHSEQANLLRHARARIDALQEVTEAGALLEHWEGSLRELSTLRLVQQRLLAARREEARAWDEALGALLDRPFRNYLAMIVAAL